MAHKDLPKSINLLDSVSTPDDVWSGLYDWVFNIGKYLLVAIQAVVLTVFFSRFIFDRKNNNLSDDINDQVGVLEEDFYKQGAVTYSNMHKLLSDINLLQDQQITYADRVGSILSEIPNELRLQNYSFNDGAVNLTFKSSNREVVSQYEKFLEDNPLYKDVTVNLSKTGSSDEIDFSINFVVAREDTLIEVIK